jgi:hypothetical protein
MTPPLNVATLRRPPANPLGMLALQGRGSRMERA